jgi:hypothetical protein
MKKFFAATLTVVLMSCLVLASLRRGSEGRAVADRSPASDGETNPATARVQRLLEDASKGDVASYLDAFSGTLRKRLEQQADERGREAFAADLRAASRSRKSHAVFAADADEPNSARVLVETVFPDHNARQTYRLERATSGWFVVEVETEQVRRPASRFGATAKYEEPEGIPVQGEVVESGEESSASSRERNP